MHKSLYQFPALLRTVFPLDDEERRFWAALAARAPNGPALDIGGGSGELAAALPPPTVNLEPSPPLAAASPRPIVRGSILAPPFRPASFTFLCSRLFGVGYALAGSDQQDAAARELAESMAALLRPGGVLAIEVPLAWKPRRHCWLREQAEGPPAYLFEYGDQIREAAQGSILESRIEVTDAGESYLLADRLFVFSVEGVRLWLLGAGFDQITFAASYDLDTETAEPPRDVLRGVIIARRR